MAPPQRIVVDIILSIGRFIYILKLNLADYPICMKACDLASVHGFFSNGDCCIIFI